MQARHFADWSCSTPGCEYSREGQVAEMATLLGVIRALREGGTSDEATEGSEGSEAGDLEAF